MTKFKLPKLMLLSDYDGDFEKYNNAVYNRFKMDFIEDRPFYNSKRVVVIELPLIDGKEYGYYHLTHSGKIETERIPNPRRMERIGYPKPIISNSKNDAILVWENDRNRKQNVLLYHKKEKYLVILTKRTKHFFLITAYIVDNPNNERRLLKEYKDFIKNETAQQS